MESLSGWETMIVYGLAITAIYGFWNTHQLSKECSRLHQRISDTEEKIKKLKIRLRLSSDEDS